MQQLTSCRGAINGLLGVVVEDHIKTHFGDSPGSAEASEHLLEVVHSYFK
jgi:DNA-binding FrmR family transcriptional regulator